MYLEIYGWTARGQFQFGRHSGNRAGRQLTYKGLHSVFSLLLTPDTHKEPLMASVAVLCFQNLLTCPETLTQSSALPRRPSWRQEPWVLFLPLPIISLTLI